MSENKTVKYLKYAFGEIVLVAIGILIALGVNNWNENRKNVSTEHKYLIALLEDFETNLTKSKEIIERIEDDIPQLIGLLEQSASAWSTSSSRTGLTSPSLKPWAMTPGRPPSGNGCPFCPAFGENCC